MHCDVLRRNPLQYTAIHCNSLQLVAKSRMLKNFSDPQTAPVHRDRSGPFQAVAQHFMTISRTISRMISRTISLLGQSLLDDLQDSFSLLDDLLRTIFRTVSLLISSGRSLYDLLRTSMTSGDRLQSTVKVIGGQLISQRPQIEWPAWSFERLQSPRSAEYALLRGWERVSACC